MKTIPLTRGYVAVVDYEDYEPLAQFKWSVKIDRRKPHCPKYAIRNSHPDSNGRRHQIYMHKQIFPKLGHVDHRDTDGLNNRRHNLRPATTSQNMANRKKCVAGSNSIFKGVRKERGRWRADIRKDGRRFFLGYFKEEVDAAQAYNFYAYELHGEFARLNTPDSRSLAQAS